MKDIRTDSVYLAALPFFNRVAVEDIKVLMVSINEDRIPWQGFQPVQPEAIRTSPIPDAAEITADDDIIITGQRSARNKLIRINFVYVKCTMNIPRNINHSILLRFSVFSDNLTEIYNKSPSHQKQVGPKV